jgi:hypothetical protein
LDQRLKNYTGFTLQPLTHNRKHQTNKTHGGSKQTEKRHAPIRKASIAEQNLDGRNQRLPSTNPVVDYELEITNPPRALVLASRMHMTGKKGKMNPGRFISAPSMSKWESQSWANRSAARAQKRRSTATSNLWCWTATWKRVTGI